MCHDAIAYYREVTAQGGSRNPARRRPAARIGFYRDTPGLNAAVNPTIGVLLRGPERSEGHVSSNDLVRQRSFTSIGRASVAPRLGCTSDAHGDG